MAVLFADRDLAGMFDAGSVHGNNSWAMPVRFAHSNPIKNSCFMVDELAGKAVSEKKPNFIMPQRLSGRKN